MHEGDVRIGPEAGSEAIVSKSVTEYDSRTQPPKPTRNRRRWTKITTIVLILVGLLVAADFGLAAFAEHSVSQQARSQFGLDSDPDVTVHGFPFTTQAISGEYDHISVRAEGIEATDALRNVGLRAELHDVSAPLGDLLSGDVSNVTVGELDGRVRLRESAIANIPPLTKIDNLSIEPTSEEYVREGPDSGMSPEEARKRGEEAYEAQRHRSGNGSASGSTTGIRMSGEVDIAGQSVEIYAFAIVELTDSTISINPQRLQFAREHETTVVPPKVQDALLPNFRVDIDAADLPFTVTPTDLVVTSGKVIIEGTLRDVRFADLSLNN